MSVPILQIIVFLDISVSKLGLYIVHQRLQVGLAVTLRTCILEVLGLCPGWDTVRLFAVFLSPSRQIPAQGLNQATAVSFQILSNSTFN
jgi:hypothetical protein